MRARCHIKRSPDADDKPSNVGRPKLMPASCDHFLERERESETASPMHCIIRNEEARASVREHSENTHAHKVMEAHFLWRCARCVQVRPWQCRLSHARSAHTMPSSPHLQAFGRRQLTGWRRRALSDEIAASSHKNWPASSGGVQQQLAAHGRAAALKMGALASLLCRVVSSKATSQNRTRP